MCCIVSLLGTIGTIKQIHMPKTPAKAKQTNPNPLISPNLTPKLDSKLSKNQDKKDYKLTPKSKQQIDKEYYQKNKEKKKQQRRQRYQQQKEQDQQQTNKYYEAEAIKVLMSLKEYTELNQQKHKFWLDFIWTLKDLNQIGVSNIIEVMRIRELAENLINDYWTTAKNEIRKGKNWNTLSEEQKSKLIRYWGQEKVRKENRLLTELEKQKQESKQYEKELELVKFHEERGKIKCSCYQCQASKKLQGEIKAEMFKEDKVEKEQCSECGKWVKELDEENGICRKCLMNYE